MTEFWETAFSEKRMMWGFEPTQSAWIAAEHFARAGAKHVLIPGIGLKGLVESVGDPLLYSDDELTEGLARIFEAAAKTVMLYRKCPGSFRGRQLSWSTALGG